MLHVRAHSEHSQMTAEFFSCQDYKLGFDFKSSRWCGCAATVTESPGSHVWGVVWALDQDQVHHLDKYVALSLSPAFIHCTVVDIILCFILEETHERIF
jgi:hypothetical protein